MYSKNAWGGTVDPHILVKFLKSSAEDGTDPIASMIIFEWKDYDLVGVLPADSAQVPLAEPSPYRFKPGADSSAEGIYL